MGGLLGMLAFPLAFTFSIAFTQQGSRNQNVRQEASAISIAYQRAELLPDVTGAEIRQQGERIRAVR